MPREFSFLEKQLIAGSLKRSTNEEMAELFDASVDDIICCINALTDGKATERQQAIIDKRQSALDGQQKKLQKELEKRYHDEQVEARRKQRSKNEKIDHARRQQMNSREGRKVFKKRDLHLDQLISVRIDAKTTVFVKPGSDIEAIKKLYARKPLAPGNLKD